MRITPKSRIGIRKILLKSAMGAPQSFFDETDSGVTLNRFSQDMSLIDGSLPNAAVMSFPTSYNGQTESFSWNCMQCLAQFA
jgi:ATP-binding cassette subfamily C (CFTR/MRP) protein 1